MKKILTLILLAALLNIPILVTTSLSIDEGGDGGFQDAPWPMFSHDAQHTGKSPYDTTINTGREIWRFEIPGGITSSPSIGKDGVIYVGAKTGLSDNFYAINPDGTLKWSFKAGNWVRSSPAIDDHGIVYFGSNDCNLYALDQNGTELWKCWIGTFPVSSPVIGEDGTIYMASCSNKLSAVNPNGTKKWEFETGDSIYCSPALDNNGVIYIGSNDHYLYALYPNGTLKWRYKTENYVQSAPAIDNEGVIYVGSWDNYLYAILPNGTLKWKLKTGDSIDNSSPAIGNDGTIYVGSYDGFVYAINREGTLKWKYPTGDSIISSPALDKNDILFIGSMDGKIYAINPDGTEKWTKKVLSSKQYQFRYISSSPAIGPDGTVYIGSWFGSEEPSWGYLHAIRNGYDKGIEIGRPKNGYLYIFNREIIKSQSSIPTIIGKITIEPEIISQENIEAVEFFVNYEHKYTDYSAPFEWVWNEKHNINEYLRHDQISVRAYYNDGDKVGSDMRTIKMFNPFGEDG